jgi:hypothetical protein
LFGLDEKSIRKALAAGRIRALPDGKIDPIATRAAWASSTDPARSKVRIPDPPRVRTLDDAEEAVTLIRRVLIEEGAEVGGVVDFGLARTAETILKARELDLRIRERQRGLVPLDRVRRHVEKAFGGFCQAMQRLPSRHAAAMAAEIGCSQFELERALTAVFSAELDELAPPVVTA